MVKPKDWVKGRIIEISHVSIVTGDGMDNIMKGLKTIGVRCTARDPCFVSKLREVAVRCEKVVQAVSCRDLIARNLRCHKIVLARSGSCPVGWVTLSDRPRGKLLE